MLLSRWSCSSLFRDQEWFSWRESALESDQEFTDRQGSGKSVRKQTKWQIQKEQYNIESFETKKWVATASCTNEIVPDISSRNILQVFINMNTSSTFPSSQLSGSPLWCLVAEELRAEPSSHSSHTSCSSSAMLTAQSSAKLSVGTTEEQKTRSEGQGKLRNTLPSLAESKKIFPLWVFKSNRQLVGAAEHIRKELHGRNMNTYIEGITGNNLNLCDCRSVCYKCGKERANFTGGGKDREGKFSWAVDRKVRKWQGTKLQSVINNCYTAFSQLPPADILSSSWKKCIGWKRVGWLKIAEERGIMGEMTTEKYNLI